MKRHLMLAKVNIVINCNCAISCTLPYVSLSVSIFVFLLFNYVETKIERYTEVLVYVWFFSCFSWIFRCSNRGSEMLQFAVVVIRNKRCVNVYDCFWHMLKFPMGAYFHFFGFHLVFADKHTKWQRQKVAM